MLSRIKSFTASFYVFMLAAVSIAAYRELRNISLSQLQEIFHSQQPAMVIGMFLLGLAAFLATGIYDVFARRHFGIDIPPLKALTIGCIAQAFNNFAGLGGLTGGALRTKHYTSRGINPKNALNLTLLIWLANLLGLFVLTIATIAYAHEYLGKEIIVAIVGVGYIAFFFCGQKIHFKQLDFRRSFLSIPNARQKGELLFASVADWLAAALFFWSCLHLFAPELNLAFALFVYSFSTIIGLLSMLPAGIGAFDVTVISMLSAAGSDPSHLVLGILLFRVAYYLVPWLLAILLSTNEFFTNRNSLTGIYNRRNVFHSFLWIGTCFCGTVLVVSALTPEIVVRVLRINAIIPHSIQRASSLTTLSIGIALLVLSIGIRARVARIYSVCVSLLITGAISVMLSGLNYEEAILLSVFAVLLILARDSFHAEPFKPTPIRLVISGLLVIVLPISIVLIREFGFNSNTIYHRISTSGNLANTVAINTAISLVIVFMLMFAKSKKLSFETPNEAQINRFADFLLHHQGSSYSYLFALGDKQVFYNQQETVAFLYRPHKGSMLVLGDPIGETEDFADGFAELIQFAIAHDMKIAFYQVSAKYLENLVEHGMRFIKVGEDASIQLDAYSNVGNSGKIYRRMRNRMVQNGTHFEIIYPPFDSQTIQQLREVSDSWLGSREEMGFSLGFFCAEYLSAGPIGVVKSKDRIEGFANIVFIDSNRVSFDLMRFRPDSPGGTMDGIMVSLIEWAKALGFKQLNIGMAPLSNVGRQKYSHGTEKVVKYVHDFGNQIYNFRGIRAYKEKFKPVWESRYLVYPATRCLPAVLFALLEIINRPKNRETYKAKYLRESFGKRLRQDVMPYLTNNADNKQNVNTANQEDKKQIFQKQNQRLPEKLQQPANAVKL
ncbi:bifunctional lysylphosphatidylglycerol flippase/synthetase MprF [Arcanobacterium hippocoleae]